MFRWIFVTVLLSASAVAAVWMLVPRLNSLSATPPAVSPESASPESAAKKKPPVERPQPAPAPPRQVSASGTRGQPEVFVYHNNNPSQILSEPIVIPDCPLVIVEKQEVASEKEGVILFIGTDVQMGENVPPDKQLPEARLGFLAILVGKNKVEEDDFQLPNDPTRWYRRARATDPLEPEKVFLFEEKRMVRKLQVGDRVKRGQLLALVNPAKSADEVRVKIAKLLEVERKRQAASDTKKEYARRLTNYKDANRRTPGSIPLDSLMETQLQFVKSQAEERVAEAEIIEAQCTLNAAATDLKMHAIHAAIDGVVKAIYRNHQGDAVKPYEAILRIENPKRLRVEGRLEVQEALKLKEGMTAIVEASRPESPRLVLSGHLGTVNCVAVSKGKRPVIVSGSDDETLRGWDSVTGALLWEVWSLRSAVRAVACTPPTSKYNLACFGCADGTVRLLDLDHPEQKPREMAERHRRPVLGVAFRPDGEVIATCGDDSLIRLWKTETGELIRTLSGHSAPVTSVQFASSKRLVSAGKDKRLIVWDVEDVNRAHAIGPRFDGRGGQVLTLGVSPDGKTVLFDQGKELRLLTLENRHMIGTLQNPSEERDFTTMALFSPDGKAILTNGSAPGRLQLWRTPVTQMRGSELRQFVWMKGIATCGAFAPEDSSFAVTGTQDHKVLVWAMPSKEEIDSRLEARLTLVEHYLETQTRDVRVWAELEAPEWLIPGMRATLVVLPTGK
jgi:WD40 repeat protein/biotin carboxyl carrier protein